MMSSFTSASLARGAPTIFELVDRTRKFIKFELVHAGVAVAIFFGIFLVLQPWKYVTSEDNRSYWMVGLPLIYFLFDLSCALLLHFSLGNELRPRTCKLWMILQVANLILLTLLGFTMIWEIEFVDYSYLKLTAALVVLYIFKGYRISLMQKLVLDMYARLSVTCIGGSMNNIVSGTRSTTAISSNNNRGSSISSIGTTSSSHHFHQQHHHHSNQPGVEREQIQRPTFPTSIQQPEGSLYLPAVGSSLSP